MEVLQFSRAKTALSDVFDEVERSGARVVARRKSPRVAFLRLDELEELLAQHYPFTTEISRAEDGTISIWLEQFAVYGRAPSLAEAIEDLLDEVEDYVAEWEEALHQAPDHRQRRWWVHRAQLAGGRDELRHAIFGDARASS